MANLLPGTSQAIGGLVGTLQNNRQLKQQEQDMLFKQEMEMRKIQEQKALADKFSAASMASGTIPPATTDFISSAVGSGGISPAQAAGYLMPNMSDLAAYMTNIAITSKDPEIRSGAAQGLMFMEKMAKFGDVFKIQAQAEEDRKLNDANAQQKSKLQKEEYGLKSALQREEYDLRKDLELQKEKLPKKEKVEPKTLGIVIGSQFEGVGNKIKTYLAGENQDAKKNFFGLNDIEKDKYEAISDFRLSMNQPLGETEQYKYLYEIRSDIENELIKSYGTTYIVLPQNKRDEIITGIAWNLMNTNGEISTVNDDGRAVPLKFDVTYTPYDFIIPNLSDSDKEVLDYAYGLPVGSADRKAIIQELKKLYPTTKFPN